MHYIWKGKSRKEGGMEGRRKKGRMREKKKKSQVDHM